MNVNLNYTCNTKPKPNKDLVNSLQIDFLLSFLYQLCVD